MKGFLVPWAALISAALAAWASRPGSPFYLADRPNARSLHHGVTSRGGGIGLLLAVASTLAGAAWIGVVPPSLPVVFLPALLMLARIGYRDDRGHVTPARRLRWQVAAVIWFVAAGALALQWPLSSAAQWPAGLPDWPLLVAAAGAAVLWLIATINAYNFMDGMDGLAAGTAVIGFSVYAGLGWQAADSAFFWVALPIAAAAAGLLAFNWHPARVFMGDTGSTVLGFLAGALALWAIAAGVAPAPVVALVFLALWLDSGLTLLHRLCARAPLTQAHREHLFQRLYARGYSQSRIVGGYLMCIAMTGGIALSLRGAPAAVSWTALGTCALAGAALHARLLLRAEPAALALHP